MVSIKIIKRKLQQQLELESIMQQLEALNSKPSKKGALHVMLERKNEKSYENLFLSNWRFSAPTMKRCLH